MPECTLGPVAKSRCMIEAILADLAEVHTSEGGGGISSIILEATDVYTVTISQEGRQSLYTYMLEVTGSGDVRILDRKSAIKSR